jgi:hypothetical protein
MLKPKNNAIAGAIFALASIAAGQAQAVEPASLGESHEFHQVQLKSAKRNVATAARAILDPNTVGRSNFYYALNEYARAYPELAPVIIADMGRAIDQRPIDEWPKAIQVLSYIAPEDGRINTLLANQMHAIVQKAQAALHDPRIDRQAAIGALVAVAAAAPGLSSWVNDALVSSLDSPAPAP